MDAMGTDHSSLKVKNQVYKGWLKVGHWLSESPKQNGKTHKKLYNIYIYTTWKVDGATPMYWFIMAPY